MVLLLYNTLLTNDFILQNLAESPNIFRYCKKNIVGRKFMFVASLSQLKVFPRNREKLNPALQNLLKSLFFGIENIFLPYFKVF